MIGQFMVKHKKLVILSGLILLALGGSWIYAHRAEDISYIIETVKRQNVQKVVNATGEVRAIELVTVGAQVSGKIEKIYVTIGQQVKEGDLIAEIDSTTQQNEVDTAKAKLKSYQAQLEAAKTTLKVAERQYKRTQQLKKQNAVSEEDVENAENTYETAKSQVTQIEAQLTETTIALSTAETNLGYTRITAPLNGTVVSVPVKVGQTINANMSTPTLVQIADLSQMEILIEISEGDIDNIKPGVKVTYAVLSGLTDNYETTLKSIDPGLTLLTNGDYTEVVGSSEAIYYYGRLVVPNEEGRLRIGMTTQNVIYVDSAMDVLTVPVTAVKEEKGLKYVTVWTPAGIERRDIETGLSDGLNVEVTAGVKEGEQVVITQLSSSQISSKTANVRGPRL